MIPVILLNGKLDAGRLEQAFDELVAIAKDHKEIYLVVDSLGGNPVSVLDFLDMVREPLQDCKVGIKIYRAGSAAALLATSLGDTREMAQNGKIVFHRAAIEQLSSSDIVDGRIPDNLLHYIDRFDKAIKQVLERFSLHENPSLMGKFFGGDSLELEAIECLKYGIVQSTF